MQQVDVVNTALGWLGKEPVADLSSTSLAKNNAAAKIMRSIETSRRVVLRRHGWLCALTYAELQPAVIPNYANWKFPYVFLVPGDLLRLWEVDGCTVSGPAGVVGDTPWQLGTEEAPGGSARQVIRFGSNWGTFGAAGVPPTLPISYTRLANWPAIDDHLLDAIALDAAARQARSILGSVQEAATVVKQAEAAIAMALSVDGTQEGGAPPLAASIPASIRAFAGNASGSSWGPDIWDRGY